MPYSAFFNLCPVQTGTFLFLIIHSHHLQLSSTSFNKVTIDAPYKKHVWDPPPPRKVVFRVKRTIFETFVLTMQ